MQVPALFYAKSFHGIASVSQPAHAQQINRQVDDDVSFTMFEDVIKCFLLANLERISL
jgi:hypothetical protein